MGRKGALHDWRAIDKGAIAKGSDQGLNAFGQLLQPPAHQFVIVAAQGVARDIGVFGLSEPLGHGGICRQVIHTHRDHSAGARYQLSRASALTAVACHPFHLALIARRQPVSQARLVLTRLGGTDADLLESQLLSKRTYPLG